MLRKSTKSERRGIFCRASWGTDYHTVLRNKLQLLENFIKDKVPGAMMKSMVDTGEVIEIGQWLSVQVLAGVQKTV